ncbi:hypothetical protein [Levilactobacillus mulengensis]|uniref:hypothetical protein n=1 Tax=Levilactobacillus mulengensis TaxID=2486025 RepID=UPI000F79C403|nr:hypothetical protein [Levilactobacillus mulengensis]
MQLDELTNDAKFLLSVMYKQYISDRKSGHTKREAKFFGSEIRIHDTLMSEWEQDDVHETINELSRNKLLDVIYGNDEAAIVNLSTNAIVLMEHKFQDKVDSILNYATKIKTLITF